MDIISFKDIVGNIILGCAGFFVCSLILCIASMMIAATVQFVKDML